MTRVDNPRYPGQGDESKVKEAEDKLVRQAEEIEALEATVRAGGRFDPPPPLITYPEHSPV